MMSEESTELIVPEFVGPPAPHPAPKKDLRQEIKEILVISFVCESKVLRQGSDTLPVATCLEIYKKNPFVFFYINKQLDYVMRAIERHHKTDLY